MSARIAPIYVWLQYLVSFILLAYTLGSSAFLIRRWRRNPHEKPLAGTRTYIYTCIVVELLGLIALIHNLVKWHDSLRYDANWLFWTNVFYYCAMPSAPTALLFSAIHKCALSFFPHLTAPTFEKVVKLERVTLVCIPLAQFVVIVIQDAPKSFITVCYDFECLLRHGQGQVLKLWIYFLADLYLITITMVLYEMRHPKLDMTPTAKARLKRVERVMLKIIIITAIFNVVPHYVYLFLANQFSSTRFHMSDVLGPYMITLSSLSITACTCVYRKAIIHRVKSIHSPDALYSMHL